jgi:dinuclear metal center YbgI/SA1388 family protein
MVELELRQLVEYCDRRLEPTRFDDYCPNGLQVEAGAVVARICTGVTASLALVEAAARAGADALIVHHGYFWRGEPAPLTGMKGRRVGALFANRLSLLAYHLPLDAHPEIGNNCQLGACLGIADAAAVEGSNGLLWRGRLPAPLPVGAWADAVGAALGRPPLHLPGGPTLVRDVAWCTGAAQARIERAADLGCDAFLSGEVSEHTTHVARERGIHYLAAGHHATERLGVQALGDELARVFGLEHRFIDLENPV